MQLYNSSPQFIFSTNCIFSCLFEVLNWFEFVMVSLMFCSLHYYCSFIALSKASTYKYIKPKTFNPVLPRPLTKL